MAAMSNYLEEVLLQHLLNNSSHATPTTTYVALYTDDPTDADTGTEVTGGSYARELVEATGGSSPTWDAAVVDGVGYLVDNTHDITFTTASASWGDVTHFGIHDHSSAGNLLFHGSLTASKAVGNGDTFKFPVGDLDIKLE